MISNAAAVGLSVRAGTRISAGLAFLALEAMVLLLMVVTPAALLGQSYYGGLRGIVEDPNGSIVPNVKVSLIDKATNLTRNTITNSDGEYSFSLVVPSSVYSVVAEAAWF